MRCKNPKVHYNGLTVKAVWTGLYNIQSYVWIALKILFFKGKVKP